MTDIRSAKSVDLPGSEPEIAKMPGHWLLARLGKRVLRPGGLKLTRALLDELAIGPDDEVVEFAPGLGVTARMILRRRPQRYTGVERDSNATQWTARQLPSDPTISVIAGAADRTRAAASFRIRCCRRSHAEHEYCDAQALDRRRSIPVAPSRGPLRYPRTRHCPGRNAAGPATGDRASVVVGHTCGRSPAYDGGVERSA